VLARSPFSFERKIIVTITVTDCAPPKPEIYRGELPPAFAHLRGANVWLCFRWFRNGERWDRSPRRVDDPSRIATGDPATWGSFEQAIAQVRAGKADGIGFALKGRDRGAIRVERVEGGDWHVIYGKQGWPHPSREAALREVDEIATQINATFIVQADRSC
jgi:hypothetical protein